MKRLEILKQAQEHYGDYARVVLKLPDGYSPIEGYQDGLPVFNFGIYWAGEDFPGELCVCTFGPVLYGNEDHAGTGYSCYAD